MNILLIIHVIASLFTLLFALCTCYFLFNRYSLQHRINKMTYRMKPLIIGRNSKEHVLEVMKSDGFPQEETNELYEILFKEVESRRNPKK